MPFFYFTYSYFIFFFFFFLFLLLQHLLFQRLILMGHVVYPINALMHFGKKVRGRFQNPSLHHCFGLQITNKYPRPKYSGISHFTRLSSISLRFLKSQVFWSFPFAHIYQKTADKCNNFYSSYLLVTSRILIQHNYTTQL